jgi:hypothetical protein
MIQLAAAASEWADKHKLEVPPRISLPVSGTHDSDLHLECPGSDTQGSERMVPVE